ncbi:hypothetical protein FRC04_000767 [Tulasnella sp. 424]|nr:hypothetical protein FRC04_000767 [Tulasnella sp. 424]KAG8969931.1 hypothetical protein FRC05_000782 [Tulasnella sp. 425]
MPAQHNPPQPAGQARASHRQQRSFSHSSSYSSSSSSSSPPDYPPDSQPPPVYNSRPAPNEDTLLAGAVPPPEGIYTKRSKQIVVALPGQEETVEVGEGDNPKKRPKYGKGATISGVIELKEEGGLKLSEVLKVSVQIQGKMKLEIAEGGQTTQLFLDHDINLHDASASAPSTSRTSATSTCPSMLPFSYTLPLTFTEDPPPIPPPPNPGPVERQLPPTYSVNYEGIPGVRAEVKYTIKVLVERKRFLGLKKVQIIRIPFNYVPRSRPHLPGPSPLASFIAALKHAPEDWAAFVNDVPRRTDPTNREVHHVRDTELQSGETITSALVLPSTQTFPLTQAIPFHLQLSVSPPSAPPTPSNRTRPLPSRSPSRRPQTAPATSSTFPQHRPPLNQRPTSESIPQSTLLSLFADPIFSAPPRGRIPGRAAPIPAAGAIVGLGEGMAGDGTMYGDPRYGNTGSGDPNSVRGQQQSAVCGGRQPSRGRGGRPQLTAAGAMNELESVDDGKKKSYVRVFLQRQVVVTVKGQKVVKTIACGDGRLHRVQLDNPPAFCEHECTNPSEDDAYEQDASSSTSQSQPFLGVQPSSNNSTSPSRPPVPLRSPPRQEQDGVHYIAWEGYVLPSKDVLTVGGFRTSGLWVKDFITLTMIPPDPEHSPLRTLHHAVPVKLVSDPWEEEWWGGRRM